MINFQGVSVEDGSNYRLKDIQLHISPGELVYFVGKSGAGKTTIQRVLTGESSYSRGQVSVFGQDLQSLDFDCLQSYRSQLGLVFQDYRLIHDWTVFQNIAYQLELQGRPFKEIERKVHSLLGHLAIAAYADAYPNELSGGQQQRVAIARGLINQPQLILVDEPTANLDWKNAVKVMELLSDYQRQGATVIVNTHQYDLFSLFPGRVITMEEGRVVKDEETVSLSGS